MECSFIIKINGTRIESSGTFGFLNNVKNGNDKYIYRNGSVLVSGSTVETSLPNNTFYVGAVNNGSPIFYDNKQLAFYYIRWFRYGCQTIHYLRL